MTDTDITTISQAITTVGFPIACCAMLWRSLTTTMSEMRESLAKNTEALRLIIRLLQEKEDGNGTKRSPRRTGD